MKKEYNFAILGLGNIANKFANTLNQLNLNLLAVGSRSKDKAKDFANKYNASLYYGNYEEMLKNKDIDIVYIATPHGLHYEHLKKCLEYRKHIICEKAFTLNSKQAKEIFKLAKDNNCLVMEAMWTRFLPALNKVKEIIDSNIYGSIKKIEAEFCFYGNQDDTYRLMNNLLGGGALLDVGIYPVNLAHFLLGKPLQIIAKGNITSTNIDLDNEIIFKYENCEALLKSSFVYQGNRNSTIYLEKAAIYLNSFWKLECFEIKEYETNEVIKYNYPFLINGFEYQILSFIETLDKNQLENIVMSSTTSIEVLDILDEIRKQIKVIYINE